MKTALQSTESHPFLFTRRRTALAAAGIAAFALLSACGGEQDGAEENVGLDPDNPVDVSIQFGWHPNVENMATIIAEQKGYFEEEGLNIEIMPGGPEVSPDAQITSGNADMGILSAEALANAVINEAPLIGLGVTYQTSPSVILSLEESGIEEPADLKGRVFGVSQTDMVVYEPFFESAGVDVDEIEMVDTGADPASLTSGEVDAMSAVMANQPVILRDQGHETAEIPLSDYDYHRMSGSLVVREDSLKDEQQREIIFAMARAIERGLQDAVNNPQEAGEIVYESYAEELGLEEATQLEGAEVWASLTTADQREDGLLQITDDGVESLQEFFDNTDVGIGAEEIFDVETSEEIFGE